MFKRKYIALIVLSLSLSILCFILIMAKMYNYCILSFTVMILSIIGTFIYQRKMKANPNDSYQFEIHKIIKVYNPILVQIDSLPKLQGKSILKVHNMDDMVDAQTEIRKPIYYIYDDDATIFYLISDEVFLIYLIKADPNKVTRIENELNAIQFLDFVNLDSVQDFDKTMILQTANKMTYKVSPVRENKKKDEPVNEVKEEQKIEEVQSSEKDKNNQQRFCFNSFEKEKNISM